VKLRVDFKNFAQEWVSGLAFTNYAHEGFEYDKKVPKIFIAPTGILTIRLCGFKCSQVHVLHSLETKFYILQLVAK